MLIVSKVDEVMKSKGLTVDQVLEKTGLSRMTFFNAKNASNVTIKTALLIASALEVSIDDIWTAEEENANVPTS